VQAVVNNVAQNPSDAFTVSGNTITFTSAPSSGTNNIYVYYTSPITQVIAPGQGTVGTTQLQNGLTVNFADGSAAAPSITNDGDTNTGIFFPAADTIAFAEGGAEIARFDSSGNLGIGVTPSAWDTYANNIQTPTGSIVSYSPSSNFGAVQNAYYSSGWKYSTSNFASFYLQSSGVHSWSYASSGTAGNAVTFNEAMRIDSGGFTYINCTSSVASVSSYSNILFNGVAYFGMSIKTSYAGAGSTFAAFINSAGTQQGSIYANATNTVQFLTSSDYRLKENIAPMTGALAKVSALQPVTYNWKSDGSASQGFIAHELAEVSPECVGGEKDAVDADGNPKYQGVDTSFLVATLTAAIQEQQALITALTARITALENT
jgi:hypothetical protein